MSKINEDGSFVLDTPADIQMYRLLAYVTALALDINTGIKMSRVNVLAAARSQGLTTSRTKKGALRDIIALIQTTRPGWEPTASAKTALGIAA